MTATLTPTAQWSTRISADDHAPYLTITTCLMLVAMSLFLGIRMTIRWPWLKLVGLDDITTISASVVGICQSVCIFEAVRFGLGKHVDDMDRERLVSAEKVGLTWPSTKAHKKLTGKQATYAGDILFVVATALGKLAVSLLVLRLTSSKQHIFTARLMAALIAIWGFVSIFAISIRHRTLQPWDMQDPADAAEVARAWTGIGAVGILLELMLIIFPFFLVYDLQMPLSAKFAVVLGFAFRIPASIITVLRLMSIHYALSGGGQTNPDWTWTIAGPVIYQQIEMHFIIITATVPCMRLFLKNFNTGYLGTTADQLDPTSSLSGTKGSNSYALSSVRSRHVADGHFQEKGKQSAMQLRPDMGVTTSKINHDTSMETGSITSDGSDKIIIRKTVHVDYGHDVSKRGNSEWR